MKRTTLWILAVTILASSAGALAQPTKAAPKLGEGKGKVILTWDEFVKITGYDPARKGGQVVTIPWKDVQKLLGDKAPKLGAGTKVELRWSEFRALLEWSIKQKDPKEEAPPTDYIITSSRYVGTLADEGANFTMTVKLNVLRKKGWKRIPVLPNTVALTKVTLKPADGVFINSAGNHYELLTSKSGPVEAVLEFSVGVRKSAGINQVGFRRVAGGSSTLALTIDRKDVDVKVAGAQSLTTVPEGEKTKSLAAIPSGVPVSISWERALPKVEAVPSKLYAETRTLVAVADGLLLCRQAVNFNILHSPVRELKLAVPKSASVLNVSGPGVQDWRVDKKSQLTVVLRGEVIGSYTLRVTFEAPAKDTAEAPVLRAVGVERERGFVGVVAVANVEITAGKVAGATKIDARQLPADIVAMTNQPILLAFRYVGEKLTIPLAIKKHGEVGVLVTLVDSALYTAMQLNDGRRITKVLYNVRNNRNQFLRLRMPGAAAKGKAPEIWSVSVNGKNVSPARDAEGNVLIPLVRSSSRSSELASFPVEIVYVETPLAAAASGKLKVTLPACSEPVMHVMYNFYAPAEGKYTVGWGASGFSGPLRVVKKFSTLSTGPGPEAVRSSAAGQVVRMQRQMDARVEAEARKTGATPIRVRLPLNGKLFRLEKILVLQKENVFFRVQYRGWKVAK